MEYYLTEEQQMVRDLARRVAEERVLPRRAELDRGTEFPSDLVRELAAADLFRMFVPVEYDGLGGDAMSFILAVEEISRVCAGIAITYAATGLGMLPILRFGTEAQKQRFLPRIANGALAAFALTEASAGSDAANVQTTAVRDGDCYVINGAKQYITNAGEAEIYIIIASTDRSRGSRGASAFVVENGTPGFTFGKHEDKLGIRASVTRELVFRNCRVPAANLLGREGMGFLIAMKTVEESRPGVGAQAVGIAQGALEAAIDYAHERVQFGQPISSFQAVQHMLADMATQIEAARALVYCTTRMIDAGAKDITEFSAMSKVFASDMAMRVTTDAVQIFGGAGYMRDYPVEKMMRDAKATQIYEGANQILRDTIAGKLLKRRGRA